MADESYLVCNADSKYDDLRDVTCLRCKYYTKTGKWPATDGEIDLLSMVVG